jgi:cation:H+ antiporter
VADIVLTGFIVDVLVIVIAFIGLNWASNLVITNAVKVSTITRLGKTSIGFTLIAMSTTLPELVVALIAVFSGGSALSVGNVLGSNIFNISVIVGLAAVLLFIFHKRKNKGNKNIDDNEINIIPSFAKSELSSIEFGLFISSLIPMGLIYIETASWIVGLILLFIFTAYMYRLAKVRVLEESEPVTADEKSKLNRYIIYTILGALGVVISANFLVDSAINIAQSVGIPQTIIGATIIAAGTSLPELTVGIKSILKGHSGLAFGSIIGASFVNITLILGITFFAPALLGHALEMKMNVYQNLVTFSIITNLFFWYFLSKEKISWKEGLIFLFIYALFLSTTLGLI